MGGGALPESDFTISSGVLDFNSLGCLEICIHTLMISLSLASRIS
jgi:hypothetical protein